jgi:hypothetical protein
MQRKQEDRLLSLNPATLQHAATGWQALANTDARVHQGSAYTACGAAAAGGGATGSHPTGAEGQSPLSGLRCLDLYPFEPEQEAPAVEPVAHYQEHQRFASERPWLGASSPCQSACAFLSAPQQAIMPASHALGAVHGMPSTSRGLRLCLPHLVELPQECQRTFSAEQLREGPGNLSGARCQLELHAPPILV